MDQTVHHDAHPLLPLDRSGRADHAPPPRISEESISNTPPNYATSDGLAPSGSWSHDGNINARAQQWAHERSFEQSSREPSLQHPESTEQRDQGISLDPNGNVHARRQPQSASGGVDAPFFEPNQASRSIRITEPHGADREPREDETLAARRRRIGTYFEEAPIEVRYRRKYFVRRPRALQAEHRGHLLEIGDDGKIDVENPETSYVTSKKESKEPASETHHPDSLKKQRERLDLFIDLLFVGIISNISEHYFDQAFVEETRISSAAGDFILLFLPAWRIWSFLQRFLNSYFMDDVVQRMLVIWVLILAMVWGNNAPFFIGNVEDENTNGSNFLIGSYLVASMSLTVVEILYSIWIPWLRRMFLVGFAIAIPSVVLWVLATISSDSDRKIWFLTAAIIYDVVEEWFLGSPIGDKLLGDHIRKAVDSRHTMTRYENFFIIALGEGVFLLIRGSPLQQGLSRQLGRGVQALLIYFYLTWTYFHGDLSKKYVHALYRRWWIKWLWHTLHVPLYGTLVMLSSGILYLVQFDIDKLIDSTPEQTSDQLSARQESGSSTPEPKYNQQTFRVAIVTVFVDTAIVLFCQLIIGLFNRPMDDKRELIIGNNYIRMLPRMLGIIALAVAWLPQYNDPSEPLGVVLLIVFIVVMWEYFAGMDRDWRFFEPKDHFGLSPSVSAQS